MLLLLLVGLLAILSQIVLLRELNVAFYGVELVYALALAVWMAGNAAGSLFGRRRPALGGRGEAWLLAGAAALLPLDVAWVRGSRVLLGGIPGAYLPLEHQLLVLSLALLPPAVLLGIAFRWAAERAACAGRSLAGCYAIESAGAVAGALAATVALAAGVQTIALALLVAGCVPAFLAAMQARPGRTLPSTFSRASWLTLSAVLVAATVASETASRRVDLAMVAWSHPTVVDSRESPYARITTTRSGSQSALFLDDVLVYESETADNESLAHLVALHHAHPARMLLLGGTAQRVDAELWKHRPSRLDVVELDPVLAKWRLPAGPATTGALLVLGDPRAFLSQAGRYDVILDAMPDPVSGLTNRFYTVEFFRACAQRLAPGGVLGLNLQLAENVVTPALVERTASVFGAVRTVFPHVRVFAGERAILVASMSALPDGPDEIVARLRERAIDTRVVTPPFIRYLFADDRREALLQQLRQSPAPVNSDTLPACYRYSSLIWLSKFFPSLIGATAPDLRAMSRPTLAALSLAFVAAIGVAAGLFRRHPGARAVLLAGTAGLAGMVLETVVLLAYQARTGAIFEHLGLLLTAFMFGLAAGAWLTQGVRRVRGATVSLLAAMVVFSLATAAVSGAASRLALPQAAILLAVIGAIVGGLFSCALSTAAAPELGLLYAADLMGGCAGALAAGLVLVPLAGLAATAGLVVVVAVVVAAVSI